MHSPKNGVYLLVWNSGGLQIKRKKKIGVSLQIEIQYMSLKMLLKLQNQTTIFSSKKPIRDILWSILKENTNIMAFDKIKRSTDES